MLIDLRSLEILLGLDSNEPVTKSTLNSYRRVLIDGFQLQSLPIFYFRLNLGVYKVDRLKNLVILTHFGFVLCYCEIF